jgi:Tfp pilus assembly protein PilX
MTQPLRNMHLPLAKKRQSRPRRGQTQSGVVLIIAMILLIVISILAVTSMRNSASTEALAGNVRTTELATQAADIALRHCEQSVIEIRTVAAGGTATGFVTAITAANIQAVASPANWQATANWDTTPTVAYVLPSALVGDTATYKRPPECMMENLPIIAAGGTTVNSTASYVITARGFGPEVPAADAARSRPTGSEVWLQSHIELQ